MTESHVVSHMREIVDALNAPPFDLRMTLVQFSQKKAGELLQLAVQVLAQYDSSLGKVDVRTEELGVTAHRVMDVLLVCNYRMEMSMQKYHEALVKGDTGVSYRMLHWLLQNGDHVATRLYLGKYLKNVDVPEEFFADNAIVNMFQQYKEQQAEFKQVHREVEVLRSSSVDPVKLKASILRMQREREQLKDRIERMTAKCTTQCQNKEVEQKTLLQLVSTLRAEHNVKDQLAKEQDSQRQALLRSRQELERVSAKHRELINLQSRTSGRGDSREVLRFVDTAVKEMKSQVKELNESVRVREETLQDLKRTSKDALFQPEEVKAMRSEIQQLSGQVSSLKEQLETVSSEMDGNLGFFRKRASDLEDKRVALTESCAQLESEKASLDAQVRVLDADLAKLGSPLMGSMQTYMQELKEKTKVYKAKKLALQREREEVAVLARTERVLRSRDTNIREFNKQLEKQVGMEGFHEAQETLEKISSEKSSLDAQKKESLDELSEYVKRIQSELERKKQSLQPQILALRELRQSFQKNKAQYLHEKTIHDNTRYSLRQEWSGWADEVADSVSACEQHESRFFLLKCHEQMSAVKQRMFEQDMGTLNKPDTLVSSSGRTVNTYADLLSTEIAHAQQHNRELRQQKASLQKSHKENVQQTKLFESFKQLMQCKLSIKKEMGGRAASPVQSVGVTSSSGVNRMIVPE